MNPSTPVVHGIPNCNSVKNALAWLNRRGLAHEFHNFKKQGVSAEALEVWAKHLGWDRLINRQGTTWRQLTPAEKQLLATPNAEALKYLGEHLSLIKRPLIHWPSGAFTLGVDEALFASLCH